MRAFGHTPRPLGPFPWRAAARSAAALRSSVRRRDVANATILTTCVSFVAQRTAQQSFSGAPLRCGVAALLTSSRKQDKSRQCSLAPPIHRTCRHPPPGTRNAPLRPRARTLPSNVPTAPFGAGRAPPALHRRPRPQRLAPPAGSHERRGGVPADHAGARCVLQTLASRCTPAPGLTRRLRRCSHRWCSSSSRRLRRRPTRSPSPLRRRAPAGARVLARCAHASAPPPAGVQH